MALSTKVVSAALPVATGNFSITGVGFTPKAVIIVLNTRTSDGSGTPYVMMMGLVASTTSRAVLGSNDDGSNGRSWHNNGKTHELRSSTGTLLFQADLVSFDADGATFNCGTTDGNAYIANYYFLGGTDLTNAAVKSWKPASGTGNESQTGIGFQGDFGIFVHAGISGVSLPTDEARSDIGIGFAKSTTKRGCFSCINIASLQATDRIWLKSSDGSTTNMSADFVSWDSDGFTYNRVVGGTQRFVSALVLKGGQYDVGSDTQKTSTGTQAKTGVGFQPTGVMFISWALAASASWNGSNIRQCVGLASGTDARAAISRAKDSGTTAQQKLDRATVLQMMVEGTPTFPAIADISSLDSDGYTLNWTTADGTAREIIYAAFGSNPVAGATNHFLSIMGVGK